MKLYEFSFRTLLNALRHQKKVFCAIVCLFALLGGAAGWFYAGRTAAPAAGTADALKSSDPEQLVESTDYYADYLQQLELVSSNLSQYLASLQGSGLTDAQKADADALSLRRTTLDTALFAPLRTALNAPDAVYVPENLLDEYAQSIEQSLLTVRLNPLYEEAAQELLKTMNPPDLSNEEILNTYSQLLSRAVGYGTDLRSLEVLTLQSEKLADRDALLAETRQLDDELHQAERALNALVEEVNAFAADVAAENFLNFRLTYDANGAVAVALTHTHDAVLPQDNFILTLTFCAALGVLFGAFLAVVNEARREEKSREA